MPTTAHTTRSSKSENRWHHFLELAVSSSGASGGALWQIEDLKPSLFTQHQLGDLPLDEVHEQWPGHVECLNTVIKTSQSKSLEAQFEQANGSQALRLCLLPISSGTSVELIVELFLPQEKAVAIEQVEASVRQLLLWASPTSDGQSDSASIEFATWLSQIYSHLDLQETCYAITNETKTWSSWDRVSVLVLNGRRYEIKSVSGIDVLDPRSTTVTSLERVANSLSNLINPVESTEEAPQEKLTEYQARIQAKKVAVVPLVGNAGTTSAQPVALLVFDQFHSDSNQNRSLDDLAIAARHISTALEHALQFSDLKKNLFQKLSDKLFSNRFAKSVLGLALLLGFLAFLSLYQTELTISGTGYLEPVVQQDVFAVSNGLIQTLHVSQEEKVNQGDKLLTLRSPELEFEANRLTGELATVRQQRSDLEAIRTDPRRAAELQQSANELAAREKELLTVAANLESQIALLQQQSDELVLLSPIAGEIVTWNLKTLLAEDRPVTRTDRLLSVAQLSGDWRAKLHIDYRDTGPATQAIEQGVAKLTFLSADALETPKSGKITEVSPQLETDSINGTTLTAYAHVDRASIPDVRPGTSIQYRIECGEAPLGYVWFRRLIDRVQSWWLLR